MSSLLQLDVVGFGVTAVAVAVVVVATIVVCIPISVTKQPINGKRCNPAIATR